MKKTICLNMIVKNEAHIILETLNSVKKYIDYWVISDTGSTDGTQTVIKEFFEKENKLVFLGSSISFNTLFYILLYFTLTGGEAHIARGA